VRRRIAIIAAALAVAVGLPRGAITAAAAPPGPSRLNEPADLLEAQRLEHLMDQHIYNGQVYEIEYKDATRTFGQVAQLTDFTDSALWTGTYLASQAFRYRVARSKIAKGEDVAFWEGERDAALARAKPIVAQYHVLSNISGQWKATGEFHPTFVPPSDPTDPQSTKLSLGRGLINSEPGLLFRSCIPDNAPAWQRWPGPKASVFGPFTFEGVTYHCEDATSRDAYAGATFGMVTAFDLFGPALGGPAYQQLGRDLMTLGDFALKYLWTTPRPHGNFDFNNDLGGPFSPLFLYVPMARLNIAAIARHVAQVRKDKLESAKWGAVWDEEIATNGPVLAASEIQNTYEPDSSYYKFNLEWLTGFDAMRLEPNATIRKVIGTGMAAMEATTGDDINAHFETISYALTGSSERLGSAITHLREWKEWRAKYEGLNQGELNSDRCDADLHCIARADVYVTFPPLLLDPIFVPDAQTKLGITPLNCHDPNRYARNNCRSSTPLPVRDRIPTDFLWQRSPFQLDADRSPLHESQGIDYLLPYWMIRYYTEVVHPRNEPFPAYVGPAFS
jgi:hypothetical protein